MQREASPSAVVGSLLGKSRSKKGFEKGVKCQVDTEGKKVPGMTDDSAE